MSIKIRSLTKHFKNQIVLDGFSADIPFGQPTLITGPSGCGKTTLLRIICGLEKKYQGSVTGVPEKISYLFQEDRLMPWMTLKQNVEFVLKDIYDQKKAEKTALEMIDAVQLNGHENKYPSDLSGGMQRRTALARAFSFPCELLILDEPFKGLDSKLKTNVIDLFEELFVETEKTFIIVSHDENMLKRFGKNLIEM